MNSGSFFFEEISRMMSSLRPGAMASASMSVTNPHSYSRLTAASTVFAVVLIVTPWRTYSYPALRGKGCAAPAGRLRIRIDEREPCLEALLDVVARRAVRVELAIAIGPSNARTTCPTVSSSGFGREPVAALRIAVADDQAPLRQALQDLGEELAGDVELFCDLRDRDWPHALVDDDVLHRHPRSPRAW